MSSNINSFAMLLNELFTDIFENAIYWEPNDKQNYINLKGLINKNQGVFISSRQRDHFLNLFDKSREKNFDFASHHIPISDAEGVCIVEGNLRSMEDPVGYIFLLDKIGVAKQYQMKWVLRKDKDGIEVMVIDPRLTRQIWKRQDNLDISHLEKPAIGFPVGKVGQRIRNYPLTVDAVLGPFDSQHGIFYKTRYKDASGNSLIYKGQKVGGIVGKSYKMTFTVSKHDTNPYSGQTITYIQRPTR